MGPLSGPLSAAALIGGLLSCWAPSALAAVVPAGPSGTGLSHPTARSVDVPSLSPKEVCLLPLDQFNAWLETQDLQNDSGDWTPVIRTSCDGIRVRNGLPPFSSDSPSPSLPNFRARRGSPDAPSGYKPAPVTCPKERPTIRDAADGSLSMSEAAFLRKRRQSSLKSYAEYLSRANITGFDFRSYFARHSEPVSSDPALPGRLDNMPNIAIAASGGGYRALLNGGGAVMALDSRTTDATKPGRVGGLLQSATYISGLSGGSWLVGSLYSNDFIPVEDIINSKNVKTDLWNFERSILKGPEGRFGFLSPVEYVGKIVSAANEKSSAGFEVSMTDYWGRALSYQLLDDKNGGVSYTWSSVAKDEDMKNGNVPMPIIVANAIKTGTRVVNTNTTTVIEFNPWEMGSYDMSLAAFAPTQYLGSKFDGGKLADNEKCIAGFDNVGYLMGTSSSLFNAIASGFLSQEDLPKVVYDFINQVADGLAEENDDVADYKPNPFKNFVHGGVGGRDDKSLLSGSDRLSMVDGGMDNQNLPLDPLLFPSRAVDVVIAIDASADTAMFWPNGSSLVATSERSRFSPDNKHTHPVPVLPPNTETFVNRGLNNRPTFFGCNTTESTVTLRSGGTAVAPVIVYVPNGPYTYFSNYSTNTMEYSDAERRAMVVNGYNSMTQGNGTVEAAWPTCLACATLVRSFDRTGTEMPEACVRCMRMYCWDGVVDSRKGNEFVPQMKLPGSKSSDAGRGIWGLLTGSRAAMWGAAGVGALAPWLLG